MVGLSASKLQKKLFKKITSCAVEQQYDRNAVTSK